MKILNKVGKVGYTAWDEKNRVIIQVIDSLMYVTLEDIEYSCLKISFPFARENNAFAWIIDLSNTTGVLLPNYYDFLEEKIFSKLHETPIRYYFPINTSKSFVSQHSARKYYSKVTKYGVQLIEVNSIEEALEWLKNNSDCNK